jgi:2-amino-4-hydroxy-6-hydroxymethyldihydropteridine diphosphokinase
LSASDPERPPAMDSHEAFIGIGSNIDPERNLPRALQLLSECVDLKEVSTAWKTPPVGTNGPYFLNAAVWVASDLPSDDLKEHILCQIEAGLGRVRTSDKNAPRPIDLDIIIYDGILLDQNLWNYAHLAVPMSELIPNYQHPVTGEKLVIAAERMRRNSLLLNKPDLFISATS